MEINQVLQRIRAIRQAKGLRAYDVARSIGVSRPFYTQFESGTRRLSVVHLLKIARALDVTVGELCGESVTDADVRGMQGHLIPINNRKVWEILHPLVAEEPEEISDWVIVFNEAVKKLKRLEKAGEDVQESGRGKDLLAG